MLLKKSFVTIAFVMAIYSNQARAQNDTLYVNTIGTLLPKEQASFFRIIKRTDSAVVEVREYFMNDKLHFVGHYTSAQAIIRQGNFIYYTAEGFKISEGEYSKGFKSGEWIIYTHAGKKVNERQRYYYPDKGYYSIRYDFETNNKLSEGPIDENERKTGAWKEYHSHSDSLRLRSQYVGGRRTGEQLEFFKSGKLKRREFFEGRKLKHAEQYDEQGNKVSYLPAFVYPVPPEPLWKYLSVRVACFDSVIKSSNLHYVLKVDADGRLSDIEITGIDDGPCKTAIINAIQHMKKWKPAKRENVPCGYTVESDLRYRIFNE